MNWFPDFSALYYGPTNKLIGGMIYFLWRAVGYTTYPFDLLTDVFGLAVNDVLTQT